MKMKKKIKMKIKRWGAPHWIMGLVVAVSMGMGGGLAEAALQVSTASALEKVRATDPWPGGPSSLTLAAARNEFEWGNCSLAAAAAA